jgi:hypothetical protein
MKSIELRLALVALLAVAIAGLANSAAASDAKLDGRPGVATSKYNVGDVEVHLNGGDDVAYIGVNNIVEFWIMNDEKLSMMELGFEFSIGRTYQFDANHGGSSKYVKEEGDAVGVWDLIFMEEQHINNTTPDTLGFWGDAMMAGLPAHATHAQCYTVVVYIPPGQDELLGGFCIDNIFIPEDYLLWKFEDYTPYAPDFQGNPNSEQDNPDAPPVCFDIVKCCMPPIRGNVDYDAGDNIDISDLVYLVDYMFAGGPEPPCLDEADMDGIGGIDISDLVWLVDYMFAGGPPPVACP